MLEYFYVADMNVPHTLVGPTDANYFLSTVCYTLQQLRHSLSSFYVLTILVFTALADETADTDAVSVRFTDLNKPYPCVYGFSWAQCCTLVTPERKLRASSQ